VMLFPINGCYCGVFAQRSDVRGNGHCVQRGLAYIRLPAGTALWEPYLSWLTLQGDSDKDNSDTSNEEQCLMLPLRGSQEGELCDNC
jgi:hypothetical protein